MNAHRAGQISGALLVTALCALVTPAWSQPTPRGTDAAQRADEHFLKGKALLKAGNVRGGRGHDLGDVDAAWTVIQLDPEILGAPDVAIDDDPEIDGVGETDRQQRPLAPDLTDTDRVPRGTSRHAQH